MDGQPEDAVLAALARTELRLAAVEKHLDDVKADGERRIVSLERRMAATETRYVATMDQTEFKRMFGQVLTDRETRQLLTGMVQDTIRDSGLLTVAALQKWMMILFAALGVLFTALQYLHP